MVKLTDVKEGGALVLIPLCVRISVHGLGGKVHKNYHSDHPELKRGNY